jgi:hypothetical protein
VYFYKTGIDFPTTTTDDQFNNVRMRLWQNLGAGFHGKTKEVVEIYFKSRDRQCFCLTIAFVRSRRDIVYHIDSFNTNQ